MKQATKFTEEDKKIRKQFKVSNIVSSDLNLCAGQGVLKKSLMSAQAITDQAHQASQPSSGLSLMWQSGPANHTAIPNVQERQAIINPVITM